MALQFPSLDSAIAQFENVDPSHNNPGGLQYNTYTQGLGASSGTPGGLANFPDLATGQSAEDALVQHYANNGYTLQDMISTWAPGSVPGNNPGNETASIASSTGFNPAAPVSSMSGGSAPASQDCSGWNAFSWYCFGGGAAKAASAASGATATPATSTGTTMGRLAAGIVGFLLIASGLFMFGLLQFSGLPDSYRKLP